MEVPRVLRVSVDEGMTILLITTTSTWLHGFRIFILLREYLQGCS